MQTFHTMKMVTNKVNKFPLLLTNIRYITDLYSLLYNYIFTLKGIIVFNLIIENIIQLMEIEEDTDNNMIQNEKGNTIYMKKNLLKKCI